MIRRVRSIVFSPWPWIVVASVLLGLGRRTIDSYMPWTCRSGPMGLYVPGQLPHVQPEGWWIIGVSAVSFLVVAYVALGAQTIRGRLLGLAAAVALGGLAGYWIFLDYPVCA